MAQVRNDYFYDADPSRVWALVTDCDALGYVCKPYLTFEGLPQGQIFEGQSVTVKVRLFGKLPPQDYEMNVVACDNEAMTFLSHEVGSGVKSWVHRLWLESTKGGTHLHEEIDIDAGLMTPVFALWARLLYRNRNPRRAKLLQSGAF